jgi:predicted nucleotidyltransferase
MVETIKAKLNDIERQFGVSVLYACETGSRAWGFPSPDSDYDVRIIYKHDVDWYLSLLEKKDTIEFMSPDGELDLTGWDLKKCFKLMWKSNGALLERVQSPIVYRDLFNVSSILKESAFKCFSPIATMHHYLGMAKNSFAEVEGNKEVKLKKLFYALRATLACKWIVDEGTPPPIVFTKMVNTLKFETKLKDQIAQLVALKSVRAETYVHPAEIDLNEFIAAEIVNADDAFKTLPGSEANNIELDTVFRSLVKIGYNDDQRFK